MDGDARRTGVWAAVVLSLLAAPAAAEKSPYLGPCAVAGSKDGRTLYVALADARQIAWVELPGGKIVRRVDAPGEPTGLTLTPDGKRLIATCAAPKSTALVLDAESGAAVASIAVGHTAIGPAMSPDGKRFYVCNRFDNDVSVIDLAAGAVAARVRAVREPVAAAVAPDGRTVVVANHLPNDTLENYPVGAMLTLIDAATLQTKEVRLAHGAHSLRGVCVSPDGKHAYATHLLSNFDLVPTQVEMGWMNINAVSVVDLKQPKLLQTLGLDELYEASGNPWGIAATADGKTLCVAHAGTHELTAFDAAAALGELVHMYMGPAAGAIAEDPGMGPRRRRIPLPGKGPRGVCAVGTRAYAAQYFSDSIAVVDLAAPPETSAVEIPLGPKPVLSRQRLGELLFNDATICRQRWQSCASCHPDGRADVLNWDLLNDGVGNTKNTKSLVGAFKTPPSMAEGVRMTAAEAVRAGLSNILFANRPDEECEALDAYIQSLEAVPSPRLVDGRLSPAAERGKKLFESDRTGCARCHPAPLFTDLKMHNVGSKDKYGYVDRFDTPTLLEVWRTAPYLHGGVYATVKDLLIQGKHGRLGGRMEDLTEQELADLVEYVLSL